MVNIGATLSGTWRLKLKGISYILNTIAISWAFMIALLAYILLRFCYDLIIAFANATGQRALYTGSYILLAGLLSFKVKGVT